MTKNSFICNFINDHPDDWRELLAEKNILIKDKGEYSIFNYYINADFTDPIVQEARGIIIRTDTLEVACWPFRKFGKYDEPYADSIDWSTARVQQKIDGSIIKLWFDKINDNWTWSTNGMIDANEAFIDETHTKSFMDLIIETDLYAADLEYELTSKKPGVWNFNKDYTYIFELTSPINQVVIHYDEIMLYHIGTRNNLTGEEYIPEYTLYDQLFGFKPNRPREYDLNSLEECIEFVQREMNISKDNRISTCSDEGFVVVDGNWNRIKIKSPIYMALHNIVTGSVVSKKLLIQLIHEDMINIDDICREFTGIAHWIRYYSFKYTEFIREVSTFVTITRNIYEITGDRKFVAEKIKKHKYSSIAFRALDNDKNIFEIMDSMVGGLYHVMCKFIPDYEPSNFGYLFEGIDQYQNN